MDEHLDTNSPEASETFKVEYSPTDNNEFQECSADDLSKLKQKQENRSKLLDRFRFPRIDSQAERTFIDNQSDTEILSYIIRVSALQLTQDQKDIWDRIAGIDVSMLEDLPSGIPHTKELIKATVKYSRQKTPRKRPQEN